jgi:hypothetical protein
MPDEPTTRAESVSANSNQPKRRTNLMVGVLIEIDLRGVERDAALTELREQVVPVFKSLPGFESGTWLTGNGTGKGVSLTLWDTEPHAQAMMHQFGFGSNRYPLSASVVRADVHEVAATA